MSAIQVLIDGFITAAELVALLFVSPATAAEPPHAQPPSIAASIERAHQIHLMSSSLDVRLLGALADVRFSQRLRNDGTHAVSLAAHLPAVDEHTATLRIHRDGRTVDLRQIDAGCDTSDADDGADAADNEAAAGHARLSLDETIADALHLAPGATTAIEWIVTQVPVRSGALHRIALPASATLDAQALLVDQTDAQFIVVIPQRADHGTARVTLRPDRAAAEIIELGQLGNAAAYVISIADPAALQALAAGAIELETRTPEGVVWSTLPVQRRAAASAALAKKSN